MQADNGGLQIKLWATERKLAWHELRQARSGHSPREKLDEDDAVDDGHDAGDAGGQETEDVFVDAGVAQFVAPPVATERVAGQCPTCLQQWRRDALMREQSRLRQLEEGKTALQGGRGEPGGSGGPGGQAGGAMASQNKATVGRLWNPLAAAPEGSTSRQLDQRNEQRGGGTGDDVCGGGSGGGDVGADGDVGVGEDRGPSYGSHGATGGIATNGPATAANATHVTTPPGGHRRGGQGLTTKIANPSLIPASPIQRQRVQRTYDHASTASSTRGSSSAPTKRHDPLRLASRAPPAPGREPREQRSTGGGGGGRTQGPGNRWPGAHGLGVGSSGTNNKFTTRREVGDTGGGGGDRGGSTRNTTLPPVPRVTRPAQQQKAGVAAQRGGRGLDDGVIATRAPGNPMNIPHRPGNQQHGHQYGQQPQGGEGGRGYTYPSQPSHTPHGGPHSSQVHGSQGAPGYQQNHPGYPGYPQNQQQQQQQQQHGTGYGHPGGHPSHDQHQHTEPHSNTGNYGSHPDAEHVHKSKGWGVQKLGQGARQPRVNPSDYIRTYATERTTEKKSSGSQGGSSALPQLRHLWSE